MIVCKFLIVDNLKKTQSDRLRDRYTFTLCDIFNREELSNYLKDGVVLLDHFFYVEFFHNERPAVLTHSLSFFLGQVHHFFQFVGKIKRIIWITQVTGRII